MATPNPRPKRPVSSFLRTQHASSPKKPRFDLRNPSALAADAPEDDITLEADEIGKRGLQTKRNAVNIDGYDSDSSNENFDERASARAKEKDEEKRKRDELEGDMFADLEEGAGDEAGDGDQERAGKRKKSVKFVDVDEIGNLGQVESSTAGGHVRADFLRRRDSGGRANGIEAEEGESSESEVADEERPEVEDEIEDAEEVGAGGKKKHAPKLDAFNLNEEKEEGGFDEQLNFVRKAMDPDAVHDRWMEGVSRKDMKKAREAQEKRDEEKRRQAREDDELITADLLATLVSMLNTGETVLEALARFGPKKKKPRWQTKRKGAMDVDKEVEGDPQEKERTEKVEKITGAADKLMGRGNHDIYDTEREVLMRLYTKETGEDFVEEKDFDEDTEGDTLRHWEYRWSDARDGGETHGPYDGATMNAWNGAGYFGEGVEFRMVGEDRWKSDVIF
ncbi:MAG: hypothetical protein MMC23_006551 [Stictis urceolatum]|nr:hypothetical protein [Stictis urceolata]